MWNVNKKMIHDVFQVASDIHSWTWDCETTNKMDI